jgi:Fe2+ or Zn2+ uptake regulation protein
MVEFEEPLMSTVETKLSSFYGYKISKHVLEVQGYCPDCQKSGVAGTEVADHV